MSIVWECRGKLGPLSNIWDEKFHKNSKSLKVVSYFPETVHLRCLIVFWKQIDKNSTNDQEQLMLFIKSVLQQHFWLHFWKNSDLCETSVRRLENVTDFAEKELCGTIMKCLRNVSWKNVWIEIFLMVSGQLPPRKFAPRLIAPWQLPPDYCSPDNCPRG